MRRGPAYEGDLEVISLELSPGAETWGGATSCRPPDPPLVESWDRVALPARRARDRYAVTIGVHRIYRPRRQSHVQHRLLRSAADVLGDLSSGVLTASDAGPYLQLEPPIVASAGPPPGHRIAGQLHIPWSYPELPVWLTVSAWSSRDCILDIALRSRRRLRYPWRYYDASHRVLDLLGRELLGRA